MNTRKIASYCLALGCVLVLLLNLLILKSTNPVGYVIDIYSQLPSEFYIGLIFCFFASSILAFYNYKKFSIYSFSFITIEVLLIPYILGYFWMDRADDMTYLGETLYIIKTGGIHLFDIYPATHIFGSILSLITDLDVRTTSYILIIYTSISFISGIYIFSNCFISKPIISKIMLISSFIFYFGRFHFSIAPNYIFFVTIVFYLFILYSHLTANNISISICLVVLLLLLPFTHPYVILFILYLFVIILIAKMALKSKHIDSQNLKLNSLSIKTNIYIIITSFLLWFISSKGYRRDFNIVSYALLNSLSKAAVEVSYSNVLKSNLTFLELAKFINIYLGRYYIPSLFIFISVYLIYKHKIELNRKLLNNFLHLLGIYVICLIFQLFLFVNNIIPHQPDRLISLNFAVFVQIPLFAYSLYIIFFQRSVSQKNIYLVSFILSLVWSLSLIGCFNSPYTYTPNGALTYNEVQGMDWFYNVKENYSIGTPITQFNRYHDLFGNLMYSDKSIKIPDHFGYGTQNLFYSQKNFTNLKPIYLIITSLDELVYQKVPGFTNIGRFNSKDFSLLEKDSSVDKIYDSLNIEIYIANDKFSTNSSFL